MMLLHRQQKGVFFIMKRFYFSLVASFIFFAIAFLSENSKEKIIFGILGTIAMIKALYIDSSRKTVLKNYKLVLEDYDDYRNGEKAYYLTSVQNHHEVIQEQEISETLRIQEEKLKKIKCKIRKEIFFIHFFNGLNYLSREEGEKLKRIEEKVLSRGGG